MLLAMQIKLYLACQTTRAKVKRSGVTYVMSYKLVPILPVPWTKDLVKYLPV